MSKLTWVVAIFCLLNGLGNTWNIFPLFSNSSLEKYTRQKISSLKSLRNILQINKNSNNKTEESHQNGNMENIINNATDLIIPALPKNESILDKLEFLKANFSLSSQEAKDGFFYKILPKRDFLRKISTLRDQVEPEGRKYLTDKYNLFLNNLVPYSETIGVPPYVLNSMKIPENFDPRLQILQSLIASSFESIHFNQSDISKSEISSAKDGIQSRSDSDDQDLVSDQEPDATSKGQKKYQHVYISPRNRPKNPFISSELVTGHEINFDSIAGSRGQDVYDPYTRGYYLDESDLHASAGNHVGRGHSRGDHGHGGYGHGGGGGHGGGNGLTDPFTILGSLAFLTYLALLIQQSLNRTAGTGRANGIEWEAEKYKIPIILTTLKFDKKASNFDERSASRPSTEAVPVKREQQKFVSLRVETSSATNSITKFDHECNTLCQMMINSNIRLQKIGKNFRRNVD